MLTGLSRTDALASIPTFPFVMQEKRLRGSLYGSGRPLLDIPHLVTLYQAGELKLRELVTRVSLRSTPGFTLSPRFAGSMQALHQLVQSRGSGAKVEHGEIADEWVK